MSFPKERSVHELTEDSLSLRVGQELDSGKVGHGSVLNSVAGLVVRRLGAKFLESESLSMSLFAAGLCTKGP